ncbi:aspartic peptidase domain-containing protein [Massariosphaeria phaeospora]|uniref:Aspartic peptidase domain-containing protein n=1 Tax=Massariosphaeria phaeospora TaxID=100035 RepID=A0A7C8MNR2_9PLEO|nr:aspartic peptidase domain-containing protein [Massariosphaeria phaeospora]
MYFPKRADDANAKTLPPPPVTVEASGDFDGNDGKWSTFTINLGDSEPWGRGQNFKVLISTSSPVTLVPQDTGKCAEDCAKSRGLELFNGRQPLGYESTQTWKESGLYDIPLPSWWSGQNPKGTYGLENVALGKSSKTSAVLPEQMVYKYKFEEFWLGSFGLAIGPLDTSGAVKTPFLANFATQIPSSSFGYTAGASYRDHDKGTGTLASLVLGGYDQSRFTDKGVAIDMPKQPQGNTTLVVGVQSILYHSDRKAEANDFSFTAESSGFYATIDSTLPYLWLPDAICEKFAEKFRLTYENDKNMYTMNSSSHNFNMAQNATVTFKIANGLGGSNEFSTIELPYGAFYLTADEPIFNNSTPYFPLRRSPNSQFVLGRAFLQEAYLIVDYERMNFTVAPAKFSDPMPPPDVKSIFKKDFVPPLPSPGPTNTDDGGTLSGGAIAGIVVGIVVAFLLAAVAGFFFWKKRRASKLKRESKVSEIDTVNAGNEVRHRRISELDSEPPNSPKSSMAGYYDRDQKDIVPFPPINEMESPPAELYSAPPTDTPRSERDAESYFNAAPGKFRRRGATRESSGNNTPGTPGVYHPTIAELPGDDSRLQPASAPANRSPSDTSLQTNIDEVINRPGAKTEPAQEAKSGAKAEGEPETAVERRPSHTRGASDTTIQSDTTAVSQPTPEELEDWADRPDEPRRPLSE